MHSHLDASITLGDIVAASGVPGRTLFKHFKDWKGISPMRHLRPVRVREALTRADPDDNVTTIAAGLGFTHMGAVLSGVSAALRRKSLADAEEATRPSWHVTAGIYPRDKLTDRSNLYR